MTKWADFLISAVKYDSDRKIIHVKILQDSEDGLGKEEIIDRSSLANNLKKYSYMTVYSGIDTWRKGEKLKVFNHDGGYYIRIDNNKVKYDFLGQLVEF